MNGAFNAECKPTVPDEESPSDVGEKGPPRNDCFTHSVVLESCVVFLIAVSTLAITGDHLIRFELIAVLEHEPQRPGVNDNIPTDRNDSWYNATSQRRQASIVINRDMMDTLENIFHYTSFVIAVIFCAEIMLKIITNHREMLLQPWQVFDVVVVFVTLSAELVCHFVDLPYKSLHCIKYIVLLRLWRVPFVCRMQAQRVEASQEQDTEVYRYEKQKAEEKCIQLENSLSQQAEIIRQLKGALHTVTNEREVTSYELNPIQLLQNSKPSPLPRKTIPGAKHLGRSLLRGSKRGEPVAMMETEFISEPDTGGTHIIRRTSYRGRNGADKEFSAPSSDQGFVSDAVDGENILVEESEGVVLNTSEFQLQRPKHKTREATILAAVAGLQPSSSPRRKTRRSSTSEYLDYAKLSSSSAVRRGSIKETPESNSNSDLKGNSEPLRDKDELPCTVGTNLHNGMNSHSSSSASDASKPNKSDVHSRPRQADTWSDCGLSEESSVNEDGGKDDAVKSRRHQGKAVRRFSSCPEYAYTQRVTITSDETAFMEAGDGSSDDMSIHDNHGYVVTEAEALHCLAEFDGTKTYRSEEGIPMTSL